MVIISSNISDFIWPYLNQGIYLRIRDIMDPCVMLFPEMLTNLNDNIARGIHDPIRTNLNLSAND